MLRGRAPFVCPEVPLVRGLLHTMTVAAVSSATTALLFSACSLQSQTRADVAVEGPQTPLPTLSSGTQLTVARAASAPLAQATGSNPAVSVYQVNGGSVVNITSSAVVRSRAGQPAQQAQGFGSGFFIDADGRIITNNHVVEDASQLAVTLRDRTTVVARLVGRDPDND